tara:strand:+ start:4195 stop:4506 length:312 start_codon:yes stop_codon:yes gene_type:complete
MDEDIKNEILAALKALREGAPEVWQHLCSEVVNRGVFLAALGVIMLVISIIFIRGCIRSNTAGDEGMAIVAGVAAAATGVTGLVMSANGGYEAMSPALVLLGR